MAVKQISNFCIVTLSLLISVVFLWGSSILALSSSLLEEEENNNAKSAISLPCVGGGEGLWRAYLRSLPLFFNDVSGSS